MPVVKVMLQAYCNAMAWNPREPYHFVCANEDSNLYSFDMRKLDRPTMIHKVITNVFVKSKAGGWVHPTFHGLTRKGRRRRRRKRQRVATPRKAITRLPRPIHSPPSTLRNPT